MECCILKNVQSNINITLKDGEILSIGRGPLTEIKDKKCSRNQIELKADMNSGNIILKQIGPNPSSIDGKPVFQNQKATLINGQTLCILRNEYPFTVQFIKKSNPIEINSTTNTYESPKQNCKRSLEDSETDQSKAKLLKECSSDENSIINDEEEDARIKEIEDRLAEMRKSCFSHRLSCETNSQTIPKPKVTHSTPIIKSEWQQPNKNLLTYICKGLISSKTICGFDLDGTIICTKSGRIFPKDFDDWKILFPEIKSKLRKIYENKSKIVFFTNQKSLGQIKGSIESFKQKIENIIKELNVPVQVFISLGNGICRKPALGMWDYLVEKSNDDIAIDFGSSLYVGDAAGREAKWALGKKKDFSCSDRLFAINAGLKFHTPEEFFLGWKVASFKLPSFDPRSFSGLSLCDPKFTQSLIASDRELVVLVGYPASGKTFFAEKHLIKNGYVHINRDKLKTMQKCLAECKSALSKAKSVVVDNTNPDKDSRKKFIDVAREFDVRCRCFWLNISIEHAKHNNKFRQLTLLDEAHVQVNDIILYNFKKKFVPPTESEGFSSIVKLDFQPIFTDSSKERLYRLFLV